MPRRFALVIALGLVLAAPAAGGLHERKQSIDERLSRLHEKIAAARDREAALSGEIAGVTTRIRTLERQVGDVSRHLDTLEEDLRLHELRLNRLNQLFRVQTERYTFLRRQYQTAIERLNARIVDLYESEGSTTLSIVLDATSFSDLLDGLDYLHEIGDHDRRIATTVGDAKVEARIARANTKRTRAGVLAVTQVIAVRTAQVRDAKTALVAQHSQLAGARSRKRQALLSVRESEKEFVGEANALAAASASIAARLRAAQGAPGAADTTPSSSGLVWPVAGPVTSPFGWRWGRMHEGIDIGAPYGAPIYAAASGVVVYAGWESGYGNLVVLDHGNGLATAYGHQQSIAVSNGQTVSQGQVIGYVGCTGHCFGPHLHFEVRVNGAPVDPLGYL